MRAACFFRASCSILVILHSFGLAICEKIPPQDAHHSEILSSLNQIREIPDYSVPLNLNDINTEALNTTSSQEESGEISPGSSTKDNRRVLQGRTRAQIELRTQENGHEGFPGGASPKNAGAETYKILNESLEPIGDLDHTSKLSDWLPQSQRWDDPVKPFIQQRRVHLPGQYPHQSSISNFLQGSRNLLAIPKIMHQIFFDGADALEEAMKKAENSKERWPTVKREWRESCMKLHPSWEFRIWSSSDMEDLIRTKFPWFLEKFLAYPEDIHRADAIRPFILKIFGGVYLDLDVECYRPLDQFLQGHELVFQEEDLGPTSLVNSVIAGAPHLKFYDFWAQVIWFRHAAIFKRKPVFIAKSDFEARKILFSTGPWALRAAFELFIQDSSLMKKSYVGPWTINETEVMVYPAGSWFVPCYWNDHPCHRHTEHLAHNGGDVSIWLAGHHKNAGSWLKVLGYDRERISNPGVLRSFLVSLPLILLIGVYVYLSRRISSAKSKRPKLRIAIPE